MSSPTAASRWVRSGCDASASPPGWRTSPTPAPRWPTGPRWAPTATRRGSPPSRLAPATSALLEEVDGLLRRVGALRTELGEPAPPLDFTLADDALVAGYQATALAPLGPLDKQALLAASSVHARLDDVRRLLGDHLELLQARLAGG